MSTQDDPYIEGLFKICSLYRENKEVVREMINQGTKSVISILSTMYSYLVAREEVDPIDDTDSKLRARYLLEVL